MKISIRTIIVIIALIIIGFYAFTEVSYYSSKTITEANITQPVLNIPKINLQEKLNNQSLSQGVFIEPNSNNPQNGEIPIYGHRTLQGSAFLRLNELKPGDQITINWPNIGQLNYKVNNTEIVPANTQLEISNNTAKIDLITCHPIGSTSQRLIVTADLINTTDLNNTIIHENPQKNNAIIITTIFLIAGLIFTYFYPKEERKIILITILIITAILIYLNLFPIDSQYLADKLGWLNAFYNF